jgi:hypothetical protein
VQASSTATQSFPIWRTAYQLKTTLCALNIGRFTWRQSVKSIIRSKSNFFTIYNLTKWKCPPFSLKESLLLTADSIADFFRAKRSSNIFHKLSSRQPFGNDDYRSETYRGKMQTRKKWAQCLKSLLPRLS